MRRLLTQPALLLVAIVTFAWGASFAHAESWRLTTSDFETSTGELTLLNSDGARFLPAGATAARTIPLSSLLQLQRVESAPDAERGRFLLYLTDGDALSGAPVRIENESLVWRASMLGELSIPLRQLESMVLAGQNRPAGSDSRTEDEVRLANGDRAHGIVADFSDGAVSVSSGETANIPLDSVTSILFASTGQRSTEQQHGYRITTTDGSRITASSVTLDANTCRMELPSGKVSLARANVVSIEQLNGPATWLSDRTPTEITQTPYFGQAFPTNFDRAIDGRAIRFDGRTYSHGIGVHSRSTITYPLDGKFAAFRTQYAIDGDLPYASVTVRILLDGAVVHEATNFRAGKLHPVVVVPLKDSTRLTLEVDYGEGYDVQDRFNWIEPALLRQLPAGASSTTGD